MARPGFAVTPRMWTPAPRVVFPSPTGTGSNAGITGLAVMITNDGHHNSDVVAPVIAVWAVVLLVGLVQHRCVGTAADSCGLTQL